MYHKVSNYLVNNPRDVPPQVGESIGVGAAPLPSPLEEGRLHTTYSHRPFPPPLRVFVCVCLFIFVVCLSDLVFVVYVCIGVVCVACFSLNRVTPMAPPIHRVNPYSYRLFTQL